MRYSGMTERDDDEPWFRLGQLDVTTTVFILVVWVATLVVFIVEPVNKPVMQALALIPSDVTAGELWRVVTWPWSHVGFGLWDIVGAAIFFLFGTDLERQVGRKPFARLMGASIVVIALAGTALSALLPGETVIADLDLLGLTVILLYVAEHPTRPFFFGIPAWVIGAVIVALEVVNDLAYKDWIRLLTVIVAAALIALVARKIQLLTAYDRVPELALKRRKRGKPGKQAGGGGLREAGPRGARSKPKPEPEPKKRSGPLWGRGRTEQPEAEIVQMPTSRRRPIRANLPEVSVDDLALDALLDKIADGGLDSLTDAERRELDELRERRRSGPGRPPS